MGLITFSKGEHIDSYLSNDEINDLTDTMALTDYEEGSRIHIGDTDEHQTLYLIQKGIIKMTKKDHNGYTLTVHYLYPGDLFNEFHSSEEDVTFNIEALTTSQVGALTHADIDKVLAAPSYQHPSFFQWATKMFSNAQSKLGQLVTKKKQFAQIHSH